MSIATAFKRLHYPVDVIAQCVRWYLAYSLSLRNLEEMMAERGISVDHSTLHRWILKSRQYSISLFFDIRSLYSSFGILMKPISKSKEHGITYIELLIQQVKR